MTKTCRKCGIKKKLSEFTKDISRPDGVFIYCKECKRKATREYYSTPKGKEAYTRAVEKNKPKALDRLYGAGAGEYRKNMYNKQKGCCAICGKHQSLFSCSLALDHNHKTGKWRGLLCKRCNCMFAWFEKNKKMILKYYDNYD